MSSSSKQELRSEFIGYLKDTEERKMKLQSGGNSIVDCFSGDPFKTVHSNRSKSRDPKIKANNLRTVHLMNSQAKTKAKLQHGVSRSSNPNSVFQFQNAEELREGKAKMFSDQVNKERQTQIDEKVQLRKYEC